jgi:hypothetical protein
VLDIDGIFDRMTFSGSPYSGPTIVLAKLRSNPDEANTETTFTLRIARTEGRISTSVHLPYRFPAFGDWLAGFTPFIHIDLTDFEFPELGEYVAEFHHLDRLLAREWFTLATQED